MVLILGSIISLKIVRSKFYEGLSGLKYEKFEDPSLMQSIKEYFNAAILDAEKYSEFGTNHIKMTFYFDAKGQLIYYKVYNQGAKP